MEGEKDEESRTGEKRGRKETPVCLVCAALFLFLFLTACAFCLDMSVCSLVALPLGGRGSRSLGGGGRGLGKCPGRQ